jgi:NhaP-type Na+/H+ or K+/H+ antiporter
VIQSFVTVAAIVACWSLVAARFERWRITAPIVMVFAGIAIGFTTRNTLGATLDTHAAERVAEIVLAVLLFVDATEVKGGLFGRDPRAALRLLLIALPLSLGLSVLLGLWLLPHLSWPVLLLIACVVVPIDFAPATEILRDERIPLRIRNLLNVESGYNDGIVSPIFIFALVLAGDRTHAETPIDALGAAAPSAIKAILVGVGVGAALAFLTNAAEKRHLMSEQSTRIGLVAAPILSYAVSVGVHGNGFVSSFVCGISFILIRRSETFPHELQLLDDISLLLTIAMWFVFGAATVLALASGVAWRTVIFCVCALTIVRLVPVLISTVKSDFSWRDRLLIGCLGPRGTTSIVFGLLAYNVLQGQAAAALLITMVLSVLGSVVLHGAGSPAAARAYQGLK